MVAERVGDRVRRLRRAKRLTQQQLAEAVGTDKSYIGRLEAGIIAEPGVDVQRRIAKALGVSIREVADPAFYEDENARPDWESALLRDDRLDDTAKQALMRIIKPLLAESDSTDEGHQQAS